MRKAVFVLFAIALSGTVFWACQGPASQEDTTLGSLKISFESPSEKSGAGARSITGVATVQLKLASDDFPSILASAPYPGTITVEKVKAGDWTAHLYLNASSGATLYYGAGAVAVQPGVTTAATIRVYATGTVGITATEGVPAPTFTPGIINTTAGTISVTINLPSYLTGAIIRYTTDNSNPTASAGTMGDSGVIVSVSLTGVLKAVTVMTADSVISQVAAYSYSLPLISVKQGTTAYTSGTSVCNFGAVAPGSTGSLVYITIANTGSGADLELTGVKVELTGTSPESFHFDLGDLQPTIGAGQSTRFSLTFSPAAVATYAATVKIYSNSPANGTFSFNVTGEGNSAPTLSFLAGLDVQGAGNGLANGLYQEIGTSQGYAVYRHRSNNLWIYYDQTGNHGWSYYQYLLGDSSSYQVDDYDYQTGTEGHTRMYRKSNGTKTTPIGERYIGETADDAWTSPHSFGTAPYVSLANGIGGWARSGLTLSVYYQYQDDETDDEGVTTFQWYRSDNSSGPWTAITGQTASTYILTGSDFNKYISVGVTPKATSGALVGTMQRSQSLYINQ